MRFKNLYFIYIISYLFSFEFIDESMNINYTPLSAKSSGMGGVYIPNNINGEARLSHLSRFGGLYTLDVIQYGCITLTSHGVEEIPNTINAWKNIDSNGPSAHEIDYSMIDYFNMKDFNLIISKAYKNKYNFLIKNTFSNSYNHHGFGSGISILSMKTELSIFSYYIGIYDLLSFKKWTTSRLEYYNPKIMISFEHNNNKYLDLLNVITLYIKYSDDIKYSFDYRLGSAIQLTDNVNIFFGTSKYQKLTFGFRVMNELFNFDYSYLISNSGLPFNDSYNFSLGVNISELGKRSRKFYP